MSWLRKRTVAVIISAVISILSIIVMIVRDDEQVPSTVPPAAPPAATEVPPTTTTPPAPVQNDTPPPPPEVPLSAGTLTLGSTFEFDNMRITFGEAIGWTTINRTWHELYGYEAFYIPIAVTNLYNTTRRLSTYRIRLFGPDGLRLDEIGTLFDNDISDWGNDMRSGATLHSYMHILYNGNGQYVLEFDPPWHSDDRSVIEVFIDVRR